MAAAAAPLHVLIAYLGEAASDAHTGALQGISEANAQGKFLGFTYELVTVADAAEAVARDAAALLVDGPASELGRVAGEAGAIPVFNLTAESDAAREHCLPNLFHIIPSESMRADAVRQWQRHQPGSQATARTWHEDFEKYAAAQLNNRYAKSAGRAMTDQAWAGWAAVKLLSDTIARVQTAAPDALVAALQTDLAFDGQKGVDLNFRDDGQLRQPLLLVEDGAIVGEAPVRGVADTGDLDSLGSSHCDK